MEIKPGWIRGKRDCLDNPNLVEVVYSYIGKNAPDAGFQIRARAAGVTVEGTSHLFTQDGTALDDFAWIMGDAMTQYLKLKRALHEKIST